MEEDAFCVMQKISQALEVAPDTIVIKVAANLGVEPTEKQLLGQSTIFSAPFPKVRQGCPVFLADGSPLENRLAPRA